MRLILEDCVYRTFSSLCDYFWYYVVAFIISLGVTILLTLAVRLLTRKVYGSGHFALVTSLTSFVLSGYIILLYMINAQIINLPEYHIWCGVAFLVIGTIPLYLIWVIFKLFMSIVLACCHTKNPQLSVKNKTEKLVITKGIEDACVAFTRKWISDHIAVDKNRISTLTNHKSAYIAKLSTVLSDFCKNPIDVANHYYDKCIKMWK